MEVARLLRLDRPGPDGRVLIHLRICWRGNKVRLSSGEKVRPDDWDKTKGQVKSRVQFSADMNARLDAYESGIKKFAYQTENAKQVLTGAMVRAEIERIRIEELGTPAQAAPAISIPAIPSISEFGTRYRAERRADRSESWSSSMRVVSNHLRAFRPDLSWEELTLSNLNLFKVYLQEEEDASDATISAYIGLLRSFLRYAGRSGMPVPADYTYLELRRVGDTLQPELEHSEINQLLNTRLKHRPFAVAQREWDIDTMELTRWYFLLACHTSLRHSDLWQLQHPRLSEIDGYHCLDIVQQKTKQRVSVPLPDDIYHLLRNPPLRREPPLRDEYNTVLKGIAEQAKLNRIVTVGSYYRGELMSEQLELHQTMSSHMARRTFATLMTKGGMPTKTLQEIMGHSSISSTEKYTKVASDTVVQQTIQAWQRSRVFGKP